MKVLITGGRAPVALDLARKFKAAGHQVVGADSLPLNLLTFSNSIARNYSLPSPRFNYLSFKSSLISVINKERIDLVIPTCEEVFYIAQMKTEAPERCNIFVDDFTKLNKLHHKEHFILQAKKYNLRVPKTLLLDGRADYKGINNLSNKVVIKPAFSRFGTKIIISKTPIHNLDKVSLSSGEWVAQEFIDGRQFCVYIVAIKGKIKAFSCYRSNYTWGAGAFIFFKNSNNLNIYNWVEKFIKGERFTGQISFDFIEDKKGDVYAIECNPRTTSGVHLFNNAKEFVDCFSNKAEKSLIANSEKSAMIGMAMIVYAFNEIRTKKESIFWLKDFMKSHDVIFSLKDPFPFFGQLFLIVILNVRAWRKGITSIEASSYDLEYNG